MQRNHIAWVIAAVIAGIWILVATESGDKSDAASASSSPATEVPLELVASKSFCLQDAADAKLNVYVTVHNSNATEGTIKIRPWRRYSDASVNDSIMDEFEVTVPAFTTKKAYGSYGYNAEAHTLLECGVFVDGATEPTPIESL